MSMEINNAAQAGPSHGLFDLIFGTAPKEKTAEEAADPVAAIVRALEKQGKIEEEEKGEINWGEMDPSMSRQAMEAPLPISPQTSLNAAALKGSEVSEADLMKLTGGNMAAAKLLQSLNPDPATVRSMQAGDPQAMMRLIDARKQELRQQMPALGALEKAIDRDGLEKVVGTGSISQLIAKLENEAVLQDKVRKGVTTEDFLMAKLMKDRMQAGAEDGKSMDGMSAGLRDGAAVGGSAALGAEATGSKRFDDIFSQMASRGVANSPLAGNSSKILEQAISNDARANLGDSLDSGAKHMLGGDAGLAGASVAGAAALGTGIDGLTDPTTVDLNNLREADRRSDLVPKMAHNISFIAKKGGGDMTISINPKELGEIQLKVRTRGQNVEVQMLAQNNEVAQALRNAGGDLADALSAQSLSLKGLDVAVRASDSSAGSDLANSNQNSARQNFESFNSESQGRQSGSMAGDQNDSSRRHAGAERDLSDLQVNNRIAAKKNPYLSNGRLDTKA